MQLDQDKTYEKCDIKILYTISVFGIRFWYNDHDFGPLASSDIVMTKFNDKLQRNRLIYFRYHVQTHIKGIAILIF